jgi:MFS transporter, MHS family, proline/betaine transporter
MDSRSRLRLIAAGAIGNMLEWYDFAIYGYFAVSIGRTFFPSGDPVAQVLAAFGVFAVGYLMRPLGGLLTGVIGDRYGRGTALIFSVTTMAVPTFLVGVLPGYETLGLAAPVLLTLLRMIQGLSVGGECTTSFTFMIEHAPTHRRGLTAAVACCGSTVGMLLGSGPEHCWPPASRPMPCTTGAGAYRSCWACWSACSAICCGDICGNRSARCATFHRWSRLSVTTRA